MGSLVAALASWLDARAAGGRWRVRIEDLDGPRCAPGAADAILDMLHRLGLEWDGDVVYQSARLGLYQGALERLQLHSYWCGCSRREIADSSLGLALDGAPIYPGTCRAGTRGAPRALRLKVLPEPVAFDDRVQGHQAQILERDIGDFVLYRADGLFAYQLAVVVDDADQGVTDVVRGADLLWSTPRQIALQRHLGYPTPRYLHFPVATSALGEKLSKQTLAPPIDVANAPASLADALAFLGQPDPGTRDPARMLRAARDAWDPLRIIHMASRPAPRA
jgi:glutamyl-Q tRNA(Asp) synthetase